MWAVYLLYFTVTGLKYVGMWHKDIRERFMRHCALACSSKLVHLCAFNAGHRNVKLYRVCMARTKESAELAEKFFIRYLLAGFEFGNGLNIQCCTASGSKGALRSDVQIMWQEMDLSKAYDLLDALQRNPDHDEEYAISELVDKERWNDCMAPPGPYPKPEDIVTLSPDEAVRLCKANLPKRLCHNTAIHHILASRAPYGLHQSSMLHAVICVLKTPFAAEGSPGQFKLVLDDDEPAPPRPWKKRFAHPWGRGWHTSFGWYSMAENIKRNILKAKEANKAVKASV